MRLSALLLVLFFTPYFMAQEPTPAPAMPPHHDMHHADMAAMHAKEMQHMKDEVAKMRDTLNQMKSNLDKLKDPAVRQQSQYDVDLWEAMVSHMEGMVNMMSAHEGMGMGMGMMHGMPPKTPLPTEKTPPKQ